MLHRFLLFLLSLHYIKKAHGSSNNKLFSNGTSLYCYVDYHGDIEFNVILPNVFKKDLYPKAFFYYRRGGLAHSPWKQEYECYQFRVNDDLNFNCTLRELSVPGFSTFEFMVSLTTNNETTNITKLYFARHRGIEVQPWTTMHKVIYCNNGVGVKYFGLTADVHNITVEWIRLPLDIDYFHTNPIIRIIGTDLNMSNRIFVRTNCRQEICTYTFQSLSPCSEFRICMVTKYFDFQKNECKTIRTHCIVDENLFRWQDILLIVFGIIILFACVFMSVVIFAKNKTLKLLHSSYQDDEKIKPRDHESCGDDRRNNSGGRLLVPTIVDRYRYQSTPVVARVADEEFYRSDSFNGNDPF